jgi:hypothetical protein
VYWNGASSGIMQESSSKEFRGPTAEARRAQKAREEEAVRKLAEARAEERRLEEERVKLAAELESQMDVEMEESEVERLAIRPLLLEAERVANRLCLGRSETVQREVGRSLTAANNELVANSSREEEARKNRNKGKRKASDKGKSKSKVGIIRASFSLINVLRGGCQGL